jgi:hypothetical protein
MFYIAKLARRLARLREPATIRMLLPLLAMVGACTAGEPTGASADPSSELDGPIVINPRSVTIEMAQRVSFRAYESALPGSSEVASIEWSASGGTIDPDGLFTPSSTGEFKVHGRRRGPRYSRPDTGTVIVVPPQPAIVELLVSPDNSTIAASGSLQYKAAGRLSDGTLVSVGATWAATGGSIDPGGRFIAGSTAGVHRVMASHETSGKSDTVSVTVTVPIAQPTLAGVVLSPQSAAIEPGGTKQFAASGRMSDGGTAPVTVAYTATGGTITAAGLYTAGSQPGSYRVVATQVGGSLADTSLVSVVAPTPPAPAPPTLQSVVLTPASVTLASGTTVQFSSAGSMSDGSTASVSVTYSATGGTITSGGLFTAGAAAGSFRVIAIQTGGTKADTAQVTISAPTQPPPAGSIAVLPGQSIQAAVNANAAGAVFLLKAGRHVRQTVTPKTGNVFRCEAGAVLDGENVTTYAFQRNGPDPDDVRIVGCRITRYAPPFQYGAILAGGAGGGDGTSGWIVDSTEIDNSASGGGIRLGHRMKVRWSYIHHNHAIGIVGVGDDVLIEQNEISYNNSVAKTPPGNEHGGTKFVMTKRLVVRNNWVHHNWGPGLWTDIGNDQTLYEGNTSEDNYGEGIVHEISYSAVIRNNILRRNGIGDPRGDSWLWGAGIGIHSSPNVEVYGNTLTGNRHGIALIQQNRGSGWLGAYELKNVNVHDNTVTFTNSNQRHGLVSDYGTAVWSSGNANRFENNRYVMSGTGANHFDWNSGPPKSDTQWRGFGHDDSGAFVQ